MYTGCTVRTGTVYINQRPCYRWYGLWSDIRYHTSSSTSSLILKHRGSTLICLFSWAENRNLWNTLLALIAFWAFDPVVFASLNLQEKWEKKSWVTDSHLSINECFKGPKGVWTLSFVIFIIVFFSILKKLSSYDFLRI